MTRPSSVEDVQRVTLLSFLRGYGDLTFIVDPHAARAWGKRVRPGLSIARAKRELEKILNSSAREQCELAFEIPWRAGASGLFLVLGDYAFPLVLRAHKAHIKTVLVRELPRKRPPRRTPAPGPTQRHTERRAWKGSERNDARAAAARSAELGHLEDAA